MNLRTEYRPEPAPFQLPTPFDGLFMGSCFAEKLGNRYTDAAFPTLVQPTGTVYHPIALLWQLRWLSGEWEAPDSASVFAEGTARNLMFQWRGSGTDNKGVPTSGIRDRYQNWINAPQPVLVITFGTATGYRHLATGLLVANCHKQPAQVFEKILSSHDEMSGLWAEWLEQQLRMQPRLRVILTVSPVRHLRDGMMQNMLSKSHLRILCQTLANRFPEHISYFPAFEIMIDDLRDYRFYADDLLHPTALASRYITDHFTEQYLGLQGMKWMKAWEEIQKLAGHRSLAEQPGETAARIRKVIALAAAYATETDITDALIRLGIPPNTHNYHPTITPASDT